MPIWIDSIGTVAESVIAEAGMERSVAEVIEKLGAGDGI
jgi:hypothetical protein